MIRRALFAAAMAALCGCNAILGIDPAAHLADGSAPGADAGRDASLPARDAAATDSGMDAATPRDVGPRADAAQGLDSAGGADAEYRDATAGMDAPSGMDAIAGMDAAPDAETGTDAPPGMDASSGMDAPWSGNGDTGSTDSGAMGCGSMSGMCNGVCYLGVCRAHDSWAQLSSANAPEARSEPMVLNGTRAVVWGGSTMSTPNGAQTGGIYDISLDQWTATTLNNAPSPRVGHSIVSADNFGVIVYGGGSGNAIFGDGAILDPGQNASWTSINGLGIPGRTKHGAVWTGSLMIVWGGRDANGSRTDGFTYNPATNAWNILPSAGAPTVDTGMTMVWAGPPANLLVIWGGHDTVSNANIAGGWMYDPSTSLWTPMPPPPSQMDARGDPYGIWTQSQILIWGGSDHFMFKASGASFDPISRIWGPVPLSTTGGPTVSAGVSVWTGSRWLIWSGLPVCPTCLAIPQRTGALYDPNANQWTAMTLTNAPPGRYGAGGVFLSPSLVIFGGYSPSDTWSYVP